VRVVRGEVVAGHGLAFLVDGFLPCHIDLGREYRPVWGLVEGVGLTEDPTPGLVTACTRRRPLLRATP
jgi:hypothetical protein